MNLGEEGGAVFFLAGPGGMSARQGWDSQKVGQNIGLWNLHVMSRLNYCNVALSLRFAVPSLSPARESSESIFWRNMQNMFSRNGICGMLAVADTCCWMFFRIRGIHSLFYMQHQCGQCSSSAREPGTVGHPCAWKWKATEDDVRVRSSSEGR